MVKSIYTLSTCQYGKLRFPLARGIKEGSPLSPALFVLVYETFHATLAKEFPDASFFVYVDDIAVVTKNGNDLQRVLKRVQELSLILGFQTNPGRQRFINGSQPHRRGKRDKSHNMTYSNGMARTYWCPPPPYLDIWRPYCL